MGRKPYQQVHAEVNRLRRVIENPDNYDKSDVEIINELGINRITFYRYKARMLEEDKKVWDKVRMQGIESQALRILKSLNMAIKVNTEIALHSTDDRARIQATSSVVQNQVYIMQLLERGPTRNLQVIANNNNESAIQKSIPKPSI